MLPFLAVLAALAIAGTATRLGALRPSGGIAAAVVGTAIVLGSGWPGAVGLLLFFLSGTLLSRWFETGRGAEARTLHQVLANGAVATLGAIVSGWNPSLGGWVLASALVAATSDTWATAIGTGAGSTPRHLLSGQQVPPGTDGGVTLEGTLGAVVGAVLVAGGMQLAGAPRGRIVPLVAIGVASMLLDSLLGERLQARWHCSTCGGASPSRVHHCGARAGLVGGIPWMTNNSVNLLATTAAGGGGWLVWLSQS